MRELFHLVFCVSAGERISAASATSLRWTSSHRLRNLTVPALSCPPSPPTLPETWWEMAQRQPVQVHALPLPCPVLHSSLASCYVTMTVTAVKWKDFQKIPKKIIFIYKKKYRTKRKGHPKNFRKNIFIKKKKVEQKKLKFWDLRPLCY
jgi:hypothetical protein